MIKKVVLKNPGCRFCRYYLAPFKHRGKLTSEACLKGARKIYQHKSTIVQRRKWKWIHCSYAAEKNKNRLCPDFKIQSSTQTLLRRLTLAVMGAKEQYPPSFGGEIWWET